MKAFKAYDIRGIWGKEIDSKVAFKIGSLIPLVFNIKKVLVGRDARLSSPEFFHSLTSGFLYSGIEVYDAGITTTPMIYWGTGKYDFQLSMMITASHNSSEYNGLKVTGKDVLPIGFDNGLNKLEELIENGQSAIKRDGGRIVNFDFKDEYIRFLSDYGNNFSDLKLSIDCSNGVAALFARRIFGNMASYINDQIDGNFPGHDPNPLVADNQKQIKEAVINNKSDIGIIFDGDADRVMFIDEKGNFVSPDLIIALLGDHFFGDRKETGYVVQDIRTSKAVAEYLSKYNVKVEIWKVGRAFGATKLKELNGVFGGELAGHYYFRDFYYSDSGILAAILVLNILKGLKQKNRTFSDAISKISGYANTGEVNFEIEQKEEAMDAVVKHFEAQNNSFTKYDFDGYRLEFDNWWFNIRPSNTEPYLRFLAEARSLELLDEKTAIIYNILSEFN